MSSENDSKLHVEEDEKDLLIDHNYDGIQELNHPLPKWWNAAFYIGIFFGLVYFIYYQFLGGTTMRQEFKVQWDAIQNTQKEYQKLNSGFNAEKFVSINTKENVAKGLAVFSENCVQCHSENGKGDIGPNMTDNYWLVSKGTPETNYAVVYKGSEENGMPAWGEVLSSENIYLALVYLDSIKNTFVKGKEPQGTKIE